MAADNPDGPHGLGASLQRRLETTFDRIYTPGRRAFLRSLTVYLALAGLAVHFGLILLARTLDDPPAVVAAVGTNFLSALYTPFSFVLFYEVLLLILSIPESTTRSLGKQYEILSLIIIRNVFKDVAAFESVADLTDQLEEFGAVLLDAGGGLVMFLLVVVFYHVNGKRPQTPKLDAAAREAVRVFIGRKKVIALVLTGLLFALAVFNLGAWLLDVFAIAAQGAEPTLDIQKIFYLEFFTIMVFADSLILIFSILLGGRYELVFRNAAFVVSTIMLRFSLAVPKPYDVELGALSIAFGVLVLLIFNYALKTGPRESPP